MGDGLVSHEPTPNVFKLKSPDIDALPVTTNLDVGVFVPIPTLPVLDTNK